MLAIFAIGVLQAQVKIGTNPTQIDKSAILHLESKKLGFLPPRLTTAQRDVINEGKPATGLVIYNVEHKCLEVNIGTPTAPKWDCLGCCGKLDADGDGVPNIDDPKPEDPCAPAQAPGYKGYDGYHPVWRAADCDGDGETNGEEHDCGSDPYDPAKKCSDKDDDDGDGVPNGEDADPTDPCKPAQSAGYTGYDKTNATWRDADCDGDGDTNGKEADCNSDPYDGAKKCETDTDGDGVPDVSDPDSTDPCKPAQSAGYTGYDKTNATWRDADCDGDGDTNGKEADCKSDPYDGAKKCETDTDGDGVPDVSDSDPADPCKPVQSAGYTGYDKTNATWRDADCDGDGDTNGTEADCKSDPYDGAKKCATDTDGDGDPDVTDTADDDPCVYSASQNPANANDAWKALDCDGDGKTNAEELACGSDPQDKTSVCSGTIATLDCAGATNVGTLKENTEASGVTSSIPYTGGNGGPHSGQTVASTGVTGLTATLAGGDFANGDGSLVYEITGTPSAAGKASFAISIGGQTCTLDLTVDAKSLYAHVCPQGIETEVVEITSPSGRIWMDRNLGAQSSDDTGAYYQWGRLTDCHEIATDAKPGEKKLANTITPGHGRVISFGDDPMDWTKDVDNIERWGVGGVNDPCPSGFHVPNQQEIETDKDWLKVILPKGGLCNVSVSSWYFPEEKYVWSSSAKIGQKDAYCVKVLKTGKVSVTAWSRQDRMPVRCIKD